MIFCITTTLLVLIVILLSYYNKAFPEALEIANDMQKVDGDYYFYGETNVGFIIFSGAKTDERGYSYIAKLLNNKGHTVVIPKIKFHMSILEEQHGLDIINKNPQIDKWFLIGHSLGGLPISQIASKQPAKLEGIAFLASYMIINLSDTNISAIRITASEDEIMNKKKMEENLNYLPKDSESIEISGANHTGFSATNSLSRDGKATMTWKEQQEYTVKLILDFFNKKITEDCEVNTNNDRKWQKKRNESSLSNY